MTRQIRTKNQDKTHVHEPYPDSFRFDIWQRDVEINLTRNLRHFHLFTFSLTFLLYISTDISIKSELRLTFLAFHVLLSRLATEKEWLIESGQIHRKFAPRSLPPGSRRQKVIKRASIWSLFLGFCLHSSESTKYTSPWTRRSKTIFWHLSH